MECQWRESNVFVLFVQRNFVLIVFEKSYFMKKRKNSHEWRLAPISSLNIIKFIVVTCAFSISVCVVISYLESKTVLAPHQALVPNTTIFEVGLESSVWCNLDPFDNSHKTCTFTNLCWTPFEKQFIFLLGEESILHGVSDWQDFSTIDFSSVAGHNRFFMNIAVVSIPVAAHHPLGHHKIIQENEWVYLLWRFKPDNIMHIIHDDLLPLYYAYEEKCSGNIEACVEKYKLIFVDDVHNDFASELYKIFSKKLDKERNKEGKLVFLKDYWKSYTNTTICFTHASIGLPRTTSWFHYGFGKPQGAIEGSTISLPVIKRFTKFLLKQMEISVPDDLGGTLYKNNHLPPRALYVSRSINRQILNEMDVISTTKNVYSEFMENNSPLQVDYFNPAPNSSLSGIKEMLQAILQQPLPKIVFGMHSAALTVAAVLCLGIKAEETDLFFLELFPLGIDPVAVSPLKALLTAVVLQNSHTIFYECWTNMDPANSVLPSVHADPLLGGGNTCQRMDLSSVLPAVECCHNQDYLCRMFQNTVVDTKSSFPEKLRSLLLQQKKAQDDRTLDSNLYRDFRWFFPASVTNINCLWNISKDEGYLYLSWTSPINLYNHSHHYAVAVTLQNVNDPNETNAVDKEKQEDKTMPEVTMDLFLEVQNNSTTTIVNIPKQLINDSNQVLQALTWIQCVVLLKHMEISKYSSSLDAFHKCSVSL